MFFTDKSKRLGLSSSCKLCISEKQKTPEAIKRNKEKLRERYAKDPAKHLAKCKEYYNKNKESILKKNSEYMKQRPELKKKIVANYLAKPETKEKRSIASAVRYVQKKEHILAVSKKWSEKNKDKKAKYVKEYQSRNPEILLANCVKRRARKLLAQPSWANEFYMKEIYHLYKLRSKITDKKLHVDHIVPLKSDLVCGLHNEFNLRIITAEQNMKKGNRYWPDMP